MTGSRFYRLAICALLAGGLAVGEVLAGSIPVLIASISLVTATRQDSQTVQEFLKEYESTLASGRVEEIVRLYRGKRDGHEGVLHDYFQNVVEDLEVHLEQVNIVVDEDEATVSFKRTDRFTDRKTGDAVRKSVKVERTLGREGRSWKIVLAPR